MWSGHGTMAGTTNDSLSVTSNAGTLALTSPQAMTWKARRVGEARFCPLRPTRLQSGGKEGGSSLITAQKQPIWRMASINCAKPTGLTT